MEIKEISYLDPIIDVDNDCLDGFVTLEDGTEYLVEVATPQFLYTLMERFETAFVPPGYQYIIVIPMNFKN